MTADSTPSSQPGHLPVLTRIARALAERAVAVANGAVTADDLVGQINPPPDPAMGDLAIPCFPLAKALKSAPPKIAAQVAPELAKVEHVTSAKAAGPYVNVTLDRAWFTAEAVRDALADGYGRNDSLKSETIVLDYGSPNIAKHLAVHHLRSAVIGMALRRILDTQGAKTLGINHLGDWGTPFAGLINQYLHEKSDVLDRFDAGKVTASDCVTELNALYVRYSRGKKDEELGAEVQGAARATFKKMEQGDETIRGIWRRICAVSLKQFEHVYELLNVKHDAVLGESFYEPFLDAAIDRLQRVPQPGGRTMDITAISEGALVVPLTDVGIEEPALLRKEDGSTLYITRDVAAAIHRVYNQHATRILYVVGGEQKHHFQQLFAVLKKARFEWAGTLRHIDFGLVVGTDGKKLTTRSGEPPLLVDLLQASLNQVREVRAGNNRRDTIVELAPSPTSNELKEVLSADIFLQLQDADRWIAVGAVVFNDLKQQRTKNVIFDLDAMTRLDGDTGPYVQNAAVRCSGVLRKCPVAPSLTNDALLQQGLSAEDADTQWQLALQLAEYPSTLARCARELETAPLAKYLLELSRRYHRWYDKVRVIDETNLELTAHRASWCAAVRKVIEAGLGVLGIRTPERM